MIIVASDTHGTGNSMGVRITTALRYYFSIRSIDTQLFRSFVCNTQGRDVTVGCYTKSNSAQNKHWIYFPGKLLLALRHDTEFNGRTLVTLFYGDAGKTV